MTSFLFTESSCIDDIRTFPTENVHDTVYHHEVGVGVGTINGTNKVVHVGNSLEWGQSHMCTTFSLEMTQFLGTSAPLDTSITPSSGEVAACMSIVPPVSPGFSTILTPCLTVWTLCTALTHLWLQLTALTTPMTTRLATMTPHPFRKTPYKWGSFPISRLRTWCYVRYTCNQHFELRFGGSPTTLVNQCQWGGVWSVTDLTGYTCERMYTNYFDRLF